MESRSNEPIEVLAILKEESNLPFSAAQKEWRLRLARDYDDAEEILGEGSVEVIVSDYWIDGGHTWRDLLQEKPAKPVRPLVIVVDRNADEAMWVEVLTHGAFDLLKSPLDFAELERTLSAASRTLRPTLMPARGAGTREDTSKKHAAAA